MAPHAEGAQTIRHNWWAFLGRLPRRGRIGACWVSKALDFSEALKQPNPTIVLQGLTNAFNYEKQLLDQCRANNLDRVAVSIDDGEVAVGDLHPILPVPYIIFELADGDVRSRLNLGELYTILAKRP